jgi:hypothetical protein
MTGAIVFNWGAGVPGREAKGLEVFGNALAHFDGLAKEGRVHGHREYFNLTGKSGGLMIVDGEVEELLKIQSEDASIKLLAQAEAIVQDFEVTIVVGGTEQTVQQEVTRFTGALGELGYM